MKTFLFGLTLLAAIGIGSYAFSWDDEANRVCSVSEQRYTEWLKLTPDRTLLSERKGFTGLPDSLAGAEAAIPEAGVLAEHYAHLQLKMECLAIVSALLLLSVSAGWIELSRTKHGTKSDRPELKTAS
jgi:hypothetical protein